MIIKSKEVSYTWIVAVAPDVQHKERGGEEEKQQRRQCQEQLHAFVQGGGVPELETEEELRPDESRRGGQEEGGGQETPFLRHDSVHQLHAHHAQEVTLSTSNLVNLDYPLKLKKEKWFKIFERQWFFK